MKLWIILILKGFFASSLAFIFMEAAHYAVFGIFANGEAANAISTLSMGVGLLFFFRCAKRDSKTR